MPSTILVVDDHAPNRELLCEALDGTAYEISEAASASEALDHLRRHKTDLVITDVRMPGVSGVELLKRLHGDHPGVAVILMSAFATVAGAVEAMRLGAYDYLSHPLDIEQLRSVIQSAFDHYDIRSERSCSTHATGQRLGFESIIGSSKQLLCILDQATRAARTNSTVLIQGETGTGKELLACGVHSLSRRQAKPFVAINCGAIPKDLLESELFGHVRGAFTGAVADRRGQIEVADGGTLFLDEIGEMSLDLQVKLLRFLQNAEIRKVGATYNTNVDVRIIAATHRDLPARVRQGAFREDLYYRLNVIPLSLPSLRERREDIPRLLRFFLERTCSKHGRCDLRLGEEVLDRFVAYAWPGNIRELENVVERIVILTEGSVINITDLPQFLQPEPNPVEAIDLELPPNGIRFGGLEREVLLRALQKCDWNQSRAARYLGLSRKTLAYRAHKYNLSRLQEASLT